MHGSDSVTSDLLLNILFISKTENTELLTDL